MKNNKGLTIVAIVLIIVAVLAVSGVVYRSKLSNLKTKSQMGAVVMSKTSTASLAPAIPTSYGCPDANNKYDSRCVNIPTSISTTTTATKNNTTDISAPAPITTSDSPTSNKLIHPDTNKVESETTNTATIKSLQISLISLGYLLGDPDGILGSGTTQAIMNFQKDNPGLKIDGIPGPNTYDAINKAVSNKLIHPDANKVESETTKTATAKTSPAQVTVCGKDCPALGSVGQNVALLQIVLYTLGYYDGSFDGKFGPQMKIAVETFQVRNGLKVDGKVGQETFRVMGGASGMTVGIRTEDNPGRFVFTPISSSVVSNSTSTN